MIVSAATGDGIDALLDALLERLGVEQAEAEAELSDAPWSPL